MACFLYARLPPVSNFERIALHEISTTPLPPQIISNLGTHSVGTHACYIPTQLTFMCSSQEIRCSDLRHLNATMKRKSSSHAKHLLHRPFLLYPNAEDGQYIQLASFRQSVCNHYITLIVSY